MSEAYRKPPSTTGKAAASTKAGGRVTKTFACTVAAWEGTGVT